MDPKKFIDEVVNTRIPNPWMGVRLHEGSPWEFKVKAFNVIRIGTGEPKIFNDGPMIESLMNYGRPLKEARDYVGVGCVEPDIPGKTVKIAEYEGGAIDVSRWRVVNAGRK